MILVNNPGGATYYPALQHATWNGWTLADLVFPFFLFIMGVAIPYAFSSRLSRGDSKKSQFLRVIRRTIILFSLGLLLNAFPFFNLATLRIMGVLQRIALCYFFASLIYLTLSVRKQVLTVVLLPLLYWALMILVPVPGYGAGVLQPDGNLAAYVDNLVIGRGHLWWPVETWDPEGLLSTVPAIATTLIGVLAGEYLRSGYSPMRKVGNLALFAGLLVIIGVAWDFWFPINRWIWTSSYVAFTGGIALFFLAAHYYIIDVRKHVAWTKPLAILGMNAIVVYVLSELITITLVWEIVPLGNGASTSIRAFIYDNYLALWGGPLNGSLFYALTYLLLWVGFAALLYKRQIFIKV